MRPSKLAKVKSYTILQIYFFAFVKMRDKYFGLKDLQTLNTTRHIKERTIQSRRSLQSQSRLSTQQGQPTAEISSLGEKCRSQ